MKTQNEILVASDKRPQLAGPAPTRAGESQLGLDVVVVFTSVNATIPALKKAGALANALGAHITLLVPHIVPYPLPISSPPVLQEFNEKRFRVMASEQGVRTTVDILLCRSCLDALTQVLKPHSLVVIGGRNRWWQTAETKIANKLRRAGHEVVVVETE